MMLHQAEGRLDNSAQHGFALPVFITVCICIISLSLASFVINIFFTISPEFCVKEQILPIFQMLFVSSSTFSHHLYDLLPW